MKAVSGLDRVAGGAYVPNFDAAKTPGRVLKDSNQNVSRSEKVDPVRREKADPITPHTCLVDRPSTPTDDFTLRLPGSECSESPQSPASFPPSARAEKDANA